MKIVLLLIAAVCLAAGLTGCGAQSTNGRPQVVASMFPMYEAAAKIGGKHVHAINLMPGNPWEALTTKESKQLREASLAIVMGGGYQPEVDKIVAERTGPTIRILGNGEFHAAINANIWLDPKNMANIAESVRDALVALEPSSDGKFAKNLKRYRTEIAKVDADYAETLATCKQSAVLLERPEFGSLTRRYNLQQVPTAPLVIPVDPLSKASIEQSKASTVFAPTIPSLKDAVRIREGYGVRVAVLDPITTQTDQARRGGSSYRAVHGAEPRRTAFSARLRPEG